MKKSIVISTPEAQFSALVFKGDFEKSIKKAAELGYDGVELAIKNPRKIEAERIKSWVKLNHLEIPAIGTGQAYSEEGLSLSHPEEETRKKAVERIKDQIEFASQFGAQVIIGLIRGKLEEGREWMMESLEECLNLAEKYKVRLTLEPLNRYETNFIHTAAQGIELINKLGKANLGLLLDTFHMNIEEASIYESIRKARQYLTHVHLADSNRWAPGSGHLDFAQIVSTLKEINYQGYLSAEILPLPDPDKAARLTIEHLNKIDF